MSVSVDGFIADRKGAFGVDRPSPAARRRSYRTCAQHARPGGRAAWFAPHRLRHAHAVEMAREGVSLIVIQCQLGHTNLGITSIDTQGIVLTEIIDTVDARRPPMVPVDATLRCDRVALPVVVRNGSPEGFDVEARRL